jgi:hypothetical protein
MSKIDRLVKLGMLDHALWHRLHRKAQDVLDLLALNQWDWENTLWQWVAQSFGFKANNTAMLTLAQAIHVKQLRRHRDVQRHLEALFLGFGGWLNTDPAPDDEYHKALVKDWEWLCLKFQLAPHQMVLPQWKTGGLRPGNAPCLRLVQLAALMHHVASLQNLLTTEQDPATLMTALQAQPTDYWNTHLAPGKTCKPHNAAMGDDSARLLMINVVAPLRVAFAQQLQQPELVHMAMDLLDSLPPESNTVTKLWKHHGWPMRTAFDTQAGLELHSQFCTPKLCLQCRVGQAILGEGQRPVRLKEPRLAT